MDNLTIITTTHNEETIKANLGKSKFCEENDVLFTSDYGNVSKSYNSGFTLKDSNYLVFVHEDVFFPDGFEEQLEEALFYLEGHEWVKGTEWGVLGVAGVRLDSAGKRTYHGNILDRGNEWGKKIIKPEPVQTLDELLLIVNPHHGLIFDEQFDLDFYGADICMQAHAKGLGVYVIPGYVHHNSSRPFGHRGDSFWLNKSRFENKWKHKLPIATTCAIMK